MKDYHVPPDKHQLDKNLLSRTTFFLLTFVHVFGAEPIMPRVRCNFYSTMGYFTDINSTQFITTASNSTELSKVNLYISPITSERLEVLQTSK